MLTPEQQEHYARHLLLDGFDQDRVRAASVAVRGVGPAAQWCARYLAASGVGRLRVDEPAWHPELRALGPWVELVEAAAVTVAPGEAADPVGGALQGARAAADTLRAICDGGVSGFWSSP